MTLASWSFILYLNITQKNTRYYCGNAYIKYSQNIIWSAFSKNEQILE